MDLTHISSKFNFYQQIRMLLRKLRADKLPVPELLDSKLYMVSTLSMGAPDGQVASIEQTADDDPLKVTLWQNGLTGAMGALPTAYSEWMIERHYRYGDHSAKSFLDIFNHRIYCLDYLAWQKNHFYASAESDMQMPMQQAILALTGGLMSASVFGRESYAHLFTAPVRSLVNLEVWLGHYYGVHTCITPFTGDWKIVEEAEHCQIGNPSQTLGTAPMIGRVRWDIQSHFDVTLGPMELGTSRHFIPQGKFYQDIWLRIREYVGPGLDFSVHLTISNRNNLTVPLGAGQLGFDICIGPNDPMRLRKICLPVYVP